MKVSRTFDIVDYCHEKYPRKEILFTKRSDKWESLTTNEFRILVDQLSLALLALGIRKNENIASIFSNNSFEWNIIDMAVSQVGAVHVPVYPTISDSDYVFILNQAEVRTIFVSDQVIYNKISGLIRELPRLNTIISIEKLPNVQCFSDFIQINDNTAESRQRLDSLKNSTQPDDVCTIIYTSGTTGFPKGVMLTHKNLCSNILAASDLQPLDKRHKVLSFLPLCHIYERTAVYQFLFKGTSVYYAENLKSILNNMQEIKPDGTTVVPRVLEKILSGVRSRANESFIIKRKLIEWCVNFGCKYKIFRKQGKYFRIRHLIADMVLFNSVRSLLGGKIKYIGLGGAPINEKIERFFWAAGVPVFQGYGLTECSPLVALNFPKNQNVRIGTVGPLIKKVKVKIAGDGEILVKGPNIMKGYYKNPELTHKTIEKGYLHTGDLGDFVENDFLKITGRKKEMFKTSYGKYIVPQAIENRFLDCPFINHIVIIGEGKHYAAAIVSPNFYVLRKKILKNFKGSNEKLIRKPAVIKTIAGEIKKVNRKLGKTEQIKKHLLVADFWTPETGEVSVTQKLRRNIIIQKYGLQIRDLYKEESL